jgi:hypothetical protein
MATFRTWRCFVLGLALACFGVGIVRADEAPKGSASKSYLEFGDRKFYSAYSAEKNDVRIHEFLPAGEKRGHWNEMMTIQVFPQFSKELGVDGYLTSLAAEIETSNPAARYAFVKCKNSDQMILDFLVFADKPSEFVEWNLLRAKYEDGVGLTVYQYAKRYYTAGYTEAQGEKIGQEISANRAPLTELFEKADYQEKKADGN